MQPPEPAKKRVPDWLNSSLWSSPTPTPTHPPGSAASSSPSSPSSSSPPRDDDRAYRHPSSTTRSTTAYPTAPIASSPVTQPPVPVPPPSVVRNEQEPPKIEVRVSDGEDERSRSQSAEEVSRQSQLLAELSRKVVNLRELRRIASQGIPDGAGIRSTVWKLLLEYLPPDRGLWSSELAKKRSQYESFKGDLLINPKSLKGPCHCQYRDIVELIGQTNNGTNDYQAAKRKIKGKNISRLYNAAIDKIIESEITRRLDESGSNDGDKSRSQSSGILARSDLPHGEHPLSLGKTSIWNKFFQDTEIIEQIDRDVMRTHPDMHFFSGDSPSAKSNQEALKTILIVFAKLNPGIRYVQGMNEILAPLFYVFKNDPDRENAASAEADSFFCFVELLSGFRDFFCQQLDNSAVGIRSTLARLSQLLKAHDEELWRHLEVITKVNPQFYAFRWITLLLTQEFQFADSLHIWDTLLSDPEGPQETLLRVCCAMLIIVRRRLLAGDFTANLRLLQNYPPTNISHLLYVANKLRDKPSR